MKHCKKTIALLLSVVMTLSLFSVVGFAEDGDTPPAETFTVTFYDRANGESDAKILSSKPVNKGAPAEDPVAGKTEAEMKEKLHYPEDPANVFTRYAFDGWDKDFTNVQSDLLIFPKFVQVPKQYQIFYHSWDGSALNDEICLWGQPLIDTPTATRAPSAEYNYLFKAWSLKQGVDPTVNEDDGKYLLDWTHGLSFPSDETLGQNPESPGYINLYGNNVSEPIPVHVYAYFTRHTREYPMSLTVVDGNNRRVAGADVQVLGAKGTLLDQTFEQVDAQGNPTGRLAPAAGKTNANGELYLRLPYQTEYTVQVSHGDYEGAKIKKTNISEFQHTSGLTIQLESPAQYNEENKPRCTCACHSFIGGLWVVGLNVMYYLFKVKYVCCYDMYATHGSKLSYGA